MTDNINSENEAVALKGTVEKITYKNTGNGYTVALLRVGKERVTAVGTLPFLCEGEAVTLTGHYVIHSTYGRQFAVEKAEQNTPSGAAAILKYLSSGAIRGIGPATAVKIVERFGDRTLEILENSPEELAAIRGISREKAFAVSEEYVKQTGIRELMLLLSQYNFSPERCVNIYRALGSGAVTAVKENPYVLCGEGIGVPFETAEHIAYDMGFTSENRCRLFAGVEYILRANLSNGHTCLPKTKVIAVAQRLLGCDADTADSVCAELVNAMRIRSFSADGQAFLALPKYFEAENYIAARLSALVGTYGGGIPADELEIDYVENKLGIKFEKIQREAVKTVFENAFTVITGGPGTGKTTTLNAVLELLERRNAEVALAAPTGRAAKRMTELTGREAKTLHRLLQVEWDRNGEQTFARNEKNPLECDYIVVDEASMLDTLLFENLLRALRIGTVIILLGDVNQLPSIGAGNVLGDIISSGMYPTVELKKVFRQSRESSIITNAHAIINGEEQDLNCKTGDFFFLKRGNSHDVLDTVLELCSDRLPSAYGFDALKDIQVICPSRKLDTGTLNLNNLLQSILNPAKADEQYFSYKGVYFRKGDKIMQIKNDYDIEWESDDGVKGYGVFNGDIGYITDVSRGTGTFRVRFDDREAVYVSEQLSEIEPAYAVTVHKSQGSEFDCVVLPLFDIPQRLCYRNLLYTAITRAKKLLVIVGDTNVYLSMAENDRKMLRYTMLGGFINNVGNI